MSDAGLCFFQVAILRHPDFLFLYAAMEPFDVTAALRVMGGRAPMYDAEPPESCMSSGSFNRLGKS
jgi:hypothetical protein